MVTPAEFEMVHVPQTRSIPLDKLDPRAARAAQKFADLGFDGAVVVDGGTQAWMSILDKRARKGREAGAEFTI